MNPYWKYLFILILIVLFVGGGIFAYQYWWKRERETPSPKLWEEEIKLLLNKCESISPLTTEKADCYVELGRSQKDLNLCNAISESYAPYGASGNIYWIAYCYGGVAAEKKDGKICRKLQTTNADILDGCYTTAARILNDPDICLLAQDEYNEGQTLCIAYMAAVKMNPDICEKLKEIGRCMCYLNLAHIASDSDEEEIYEEVSKRMEKCFPE